MSRSRSAIAGACLAALFLASSAALADPPAPDDPAPVHDARELWAGWDPRAEPLEVRIAKEWDEGGVHLEQLRFTGETWQSAKVLVFAYRGAPARGERLPGVLHLHGGGQTASLAWVRYWASRGYACVSHDFCGKAPGRSPDTVTDWGAAPAYMTDPSGPRSSLHPTPRFNSWYHWVLVARRALTLLESHPRVDPHRLGVFGISVGGTLTWMVAGTDERVRAAVPIYGIGQNTYTFTWQSPGDPADEDTLLTRATIEPEGYAAQVQCPLLFLSASNDHHGRLDLGMRTLALTTRSAMLREAYTPRHVHHVEPAEARDLPLWMDLHLKGEGPAWPRPPEIRVQGGDPLPRIAVTVDHPLDVESVTVHYGLSNPWPTSRFYRQVAAAKAPGVEGEYAGSAPFLSAGDAIYAFANVAYRSGILLSTRLVRAAMKDLPGVRPTLRRAALIDPMDDDRAWFWWLAGTDPIDPAPLFRPWSGPGGERGFTSAPSGGFSFATVALGDPQWRSEGRQALLVDIPAGAEPVSLDVSVAVKFFQPGQRNFKATRPKLDPAPGGRITLRLSPGDFRDEAGSALPSWKDVDFLWLSGAAEGDRRAVFKDLRWEKID